MLTKLTVFAFLCLGN